jgi:hypothetical protein
MDDTKNLPSVSGTELLDWSRGETLAEIKNFIGSGIPDATFSAFCALGKYAGLNPFRHEIWCVKFGNKYQIMTGINGYLKFANSHPQYDNYDEPEFQYDDRDSKKPNKCTIKVWRKDRTRPVTATLSYAEAKGPGPRWNTHPNEMLEKATLAKALRRSFSELHGTYTEDELTVKEGRVIEHGEREPKREQFARQVFEAGQHTDLAALDPVNRTDDTHVSGTEPADSSGDAPDPLERAVEYTDKKTGKVILMYEQFCYKLTEEKDAKKLEDINVYLAKNKAFYDDKYQVYRSTKALSRLSNYLVDEPAINRQQEIV